MRELAAIHADRDEVRLKIANAGQGTDVSQWQVEEMRYTDELAEATTYWESQRESLQAQAEQIGGLKEIMQSIFEAAFPKDETVKLIGLTEYETTQETYNQLVDQAVDENQSSLYEAFQQQLEQRDERFRLLTLQSLEVERQLEIEKQISNDLNIQNQELIDSATEMERQLHLNDKNLITQEQEINRLNEHIFDLQKQIANVQVVSQTMDFIPVAASESLSDRIAKAKVNSKIQLANVKSVGANWIEGINSEGNIEIAHVNDVEAVMQFPVVQPVNPVLPKDEAAEIQPFPEKEVQATDDTGIPTDVRDAAQDTMVGPDEESEVIREADHYRKPVTRFEYEALRTDVDAIKAHIGLVA